MLRLLHSYGLVCEFHRQFLSTYGFQFFAVLLEVCHRFDDTVDENAESSKGRKRLQAVARKKASAKAGLLLHSGSDLRCQTSQDYSGNYVENTLQRFNTLSIPVFKILRLSRVFQNVFNTLLSLRFVIFSKIFWCVVDCDKIHDIVVS